MDLLVMAYSGQHFLSYKNRVFQCMHWKRWLQHPSKRSVFHQCKRLKRCHYIGQLINRWWTMFLYVCAKMPHGMKRRYYLIILHLSTTCHEMDILSYSLALRLPHTNKKNPHSFLDLAMFFTSQHEKRLNKIKCVW